MTGIRPAPSSRTVTWLGSVLAFDTPGDAWIDELRRAEEPCRLGRIGDYELIEEVSRGGQGVVFRARQPRTKRMIALKRMLGGSMATSAMRRRFRREVEAASALNHPNIVTAYGMEEIDGSPVFAMEWVDGVPATEWARDSKRNSAAEIARSARIARGLPAHLRRGRARARARRAAPRPEAVEHPGRPYRAAPRARLRPGQALGRGARGVTQPDRQLGLHRHAGLRLPRAARGRWIEARPPHGHLLPGRDPVRDAHGESPYPRSGKHHRVDPCCRTSRPAATLELGPPSRARGRHDRPQGHGQDLRRALRLGGRLGGGPAPVPGGRADPRRRTLELVPGQEARRAQPPGDGLCRDGHGPARRVRRPRRLAECVATPSRRKRLATRGARCTRSSSWPRRPPTRCS